MLKVNIGLLGITIIIILLTVSFLNENTKNESLKQDLAIIKSLLEDIDNDIHEIEEKLEEK